MKGATSFEDLKTVSGIRNDTFHATCLTLGLIEDDEEWDKALTEGEIWMLSKQLRRLFVRILVYCQPNKPEELWEKFKDALSQDYQQKFNISEAHKKVYN